MSFVLDTIAQRRAHPVGRIEWGRVPRRSQYVLIALAFIIVWLLGLMGYARSAVRLNWHVYPIVEDTSRYAGLPSLGEAANMVTLITLIFFALLAVSFALSILSERKGEVPEVRLAQFRSAFPHLPPEAVPGGRSTGTSFPGRQSLRA